MIKHRLRVYAPDGPALGYLTDTETWKYGVPFLDVPGAEIAQSDSRPGGDLLKSPVEVAFETSDDGGQSWVEKPNSRFLRLQRKGEAIGPEKIRTYTLPGYAFLLSKATFEENDDLNEDGKQIFSKVTPGGLLNDLLLINQNVGWAPGLTHSFTGLVDSSGSAWSKKITIGLEPSIDLWTVLNNLSDQGIIDYQFVGRELQVFNVDTVLSVEHDLTLERSALSKMSVDGDLTDLIHDARVNGADGQQVSFSSNITPAYWGRWRGVMSQGNTADEDTLAIFGKAFLSENEREKIQYAVDLDLAKTRFDPLYDFLPGEYLRLRDENNARQLYRCRGVNFSRDAQGNLTCTLIINDRFIEGSIRQARRTNGIQFGTTAASVPPSAVIKPPAGKVTPKKGSIVSVGSTAYLNGSGYARAYVAIDFSEVVKGTIPKGKKDTKTVSMKARRYEFIGCVSDGLYRWEDWGSTTTVGTPYYVRGLNPLTTYLVQYAAVSNDGILGPWSDSWEITTPQDVEPPPAPSRPTVESRLGTLTVTWDGKSSLGGGMGKGFDHVDVWALQGGSSRVIAALINGKAPVVISGVTIGETYEVWLRAYDRVGNAGEDGAHADPVTVKGILEDPQAALEINNAISLSSGANKNTYASTAPGSATGTTAGDLWFQMGSGGAVIGQWIWSGTSWVPQTLSNAVLANIDAGKITTGTLAAARLAAGTITANLIAAGAIDATKLSATAIDGKTISAPVINGGTITGSAFQTAVPGSANRTVIGFDGRFYAFGYDSDSDQTKMMWDFKPYTYSDALAGKWGYCRFYMPVWSESVVSFKVGNKDGTLRFGEELELTGDSSIYGLARLTLTADDTGGRIYSTQIYDRTYGSSSNVYISTAGTLGRSTSASKYKENVEPLAGEYFPQGATDASVSHPRDVLALQPVTWYDKATLEARSAELHREATGKESPVVPDVPEIRPIPGLLAEDVLAQLGPEFVEFGESGEVEGILYDRAWIPLIPVLRDILARVESLESH